MSYSFMRPDGVAQVPAIEADSTERLVFIRKVYALVTMGVFTYFAGIAAFIFAVQAEVPVISSVALLAFQTPPLLLFGLLIVSSIIVHSVAMVRVVNLFAMFGFVLFFSWLSLPLIVFAISTQGIGVVFLAGGVTSAVFIGLTAYTFITRTDFSFLGGALTIGVFLLLGGILTGLIGTTFFGLQLEFMNIAMAMFAVVLFSGYVLYDTSNVLHKYATDMVVPAALALTIDFIILFRNILYLILISRR